VPLSVVLLCNEGAYGKLVNAFGKEVYILPIAPLNATEVGQLECRRDVILRGMRSGARRVLELFVPVLLEQDAIKADSVRNLLQNKSIEEILDELFPSTLELDANKNFIPPLLMNIRGLKIQDSS
jgi:hypothetical protein